MVGKLLLCILLFQTIEAQDGARLPPPGPRKWLTLNGGQPEVVARGGYSGYYPDSSEPAYALALQSSLPETIMYCNVHFTKDSDGFCVGNINLQNATTISRFDPEGAKTYNINGVEVHGYFGLDYPSDVLYDKVFLIQSIFSRPGSFDGAPFVTPFQLQQDKDGRQIRRWLNIENDLFYKEHNISPESYILNELEVLPEFISSPEIGFLKSIKGKLGKSKTKLFLTFIGLDDVEPTTKTPYGTLIKDLAAIKSYASGILVPKEYIWAVDKNRLLLPTPTTLVQDAHKQGLAVFAFGFANDNYISYNYSYDPVKEYLQFTDNSLFSVDGVVTDFPSTASAAFTCLHPEKNTRIINDALIISHNGASGIYPGASDIAYLKAIEDGADIIDCSVHLSKDGVPFCTDLPDLTNSTTAGTVFMNRSTMVPEIQKYKGIFSFDLTWAEIQTLKPQMVSFFNTELARNPLNRNIGKLTSLAEFLEIAKTKGVGGVLISMQVTAYYASKRNLDVVSAVKSAFKKTTLDSKQRILIQSEDSAVLDKFKDEERYERVWNVKEPIVAEEVKKHADAVFLHRKSCMVVEKSFILNATNVIPALHEVNVSTYIGVLRNEFQHLALNYFADPYIELSTLYALGADGFVTDYPATANMFERSTCTREDSPYIVQPLELHTVVTAAMT